MNFVYLTTNLINGKQYVGSHKGEEDDGYLGSGRPVLANAIKKYGRDNFKREILEECDPSLNLILEEVYIKKFNTVVPNGYNILSKGGYSIMTDEIRNKIQQKQKGKKKIEYFIEKYGEILGKTKYEKYIKLSTIKKLGYKHTPEAIEKIRKAGTGRFCSEERKRKIGKANKIKSIGNTNHLGHTHSEETKERLRNARLGKTHSVKSKEKISAQLKGIPQQIVYCPHCGKQCSPSTLSRWHGNNCKNLINK